MNTRCKLPAKLEKDHEWLVAHMKKIAATFAALGKLSAADLAPLWAEYDSKMRAHLLEEEAVCIPLLRAYFSPGEYLYCHTLWQCTVTVIRYGLIGDMFEVRTPSCTSAQTGLGTDSFLLPTS